ncbi:cytidylate kinase-like family protein [Marinoscillum pacificum]|uniref:cytidylate kinase-like family protein n=1 Tax=Marinoscillum pacificum TaxID=392723 RepID=UPI0021588839|nr:cytidylate kinase-like family protein [Marinoscillum pacificum]
MKINLKTYLDERERVLAHQSVAGPVITISRNYGCDEEAVVKLLIQKLNNLGSGGLKSHPWKYIDKEILDESAAELGISATDVDHRIQLHHSDIVNDLLSGFNHHYRIRDKTILDKVKDIICTYAKKGNVVIIGRGGVGVTKNLPNSLHIKLTAPVQFRAEVIAKVKGVSISEAEEAIKRVDTDRKAWAEHLVDRKLNESIYDVTYNMETTSIDEITDMIVNILQKRALVPAEMALAH